MRPWPVGNGGLRRLHVTGVPLKGEPNRADWPGQPGRRFWVGRSLRGACLVGCGVPAQGRGHEP